MFESEKFKALMENEEFVKQMLSQETPEAVQKIFAENGVEATMDDVAKLGDMLEKYSDSTGELSEDALEDVAGGVGWLTIAKIAVTVISTGYDVYKWWKKR